MKAWFFGNKEGVLYIGDIISPIVKGNTHCLGRYSLIPKEGLYGYKHILYALINNAEGPILWNIDLVDTYRIHEDPERIDAMQRTYISDGYDMSQKLLEFARWCAGRALGTVTLAPKIIYEYIRTGSDTSRDEVKGILDDMETHAPTYSMSMCKTNALLSLEYCIGEGNPVYIARNVSRLAVKAIGAYEVLRHRETGCNDVYALFMGHAKENKERSLQEKWLKEAFLKGCVNNGN